MSIDSDSSETDTEELVRQEKEKRIEAEARRRAVEEAKRNAVYLMNLVAAKKQAEREQVEAEKTETQNKREDGDDVEGEVNGGGPFDELSVGSNVEVFARSNNSEQLYSPGSSAALEQSPSSARKSTRLLPSRLVVTFCSPNHTIVTQYCHSSICVYIGCHLVLWRESIPRMPNIPIPQSPNQKLANLSLAQICRVRF